MEIMKVNVKEIKTVKSAVAGQIEPERVFNALAQKSSIHVFDSS